MDTLQLFSGILLIVLVAQSVTLVTNADAWRSAVSALHLRWEREQRQAGANGVSLTQRQAVQLQFEHLVANKPIRLMWVHFTLAVAGVGFVLLLAWKQGDLRWVGLWLTLPLGLTIAAILGFCWVLINQSNMKLAVISSTLYGPAPPRVRVRTLQNAEAESSES